MTPAKESPEAAESPQPRLPKPDTKWKGIGVLYARMSEGTVEFRVLYESQAPDDIKTDVAERFGAGAFEWKVCA